MYEQAEPVRTPQAGSGREQNNRPRAPYPDPPGRRGNTSGHDGCNVKMYEQAEPVRTPQAGSGREHNVGPRAPYHFPPGSRGNTGGHDGCNVEMYEQAEPVRTPQAGFGREQNNRPRAPYQDPPGSRGNTSGHVNRGKHASHKFKQQDTSLNLYEEAESVKLENISGDAAYKTDKSTDTDRTQRNEAKGRCSCTCYMTSGLAVLSTLLIVGIILLMSINDEINNHEKDIPDISTTVVAMDLGHKPNQTDTMEQRLNEKTNMPVYRKPTHTDQYLAFDSHHPLEHKLAVIKTLFHRADNIVTSDQAKTDEQRHLRGALAKCGYQNWTFNKALKPSDQSKKTQKCKPLTNKNKANITIPYVQGVSEKLRRIFQNFNIATNFKPHSTLRQRLVHPKDRPHKGTKANVIYRLKCEEPNCNNTYIGETSRPLKVRYKEHCRPSANGYSSAIFHHLQHNQGHSFKLESTDVLDRETRWWERGVKEAIYERMYNPTLNREGGLRVDLSGTWDLALPAPRTDNT
ncbi:hypothetical protein Bbelb_065920 [Branchiostoma belcheri]|nr:hypothetical protein Bbelb_065920 [Branchiostoma belcheri]